jgi:hypothetical protein
MGSLLKLNNRNKYFNQEAPYFHGHNSKEREVVSWQEGKQAAQKRTSLEKTIAKRLGHWKATAFSKVSRKKCKVQVETASPISD